MLAARLSDLHVCPAVTGVVPHVGGAAAGPGVPTVLIGMLPAVVVGDTFVCVGPPATVVKGSATVLIGGKPAARIGDSTSHGGLITGPCCPTVLIGG
ncbi:MAG: PAAR domain-containing protein [Planctomycetaceae bacterium]|nr:PAAR domain-containing protein [Planctomycetaceae bacterium]